MALIKVKKAPGLKWREWSKTCVGHVAARNLNIWIGKTRAHDWRCKGLPTRPLGAHKKRSRKKKRKRVRGERTCLSRIFEFISYLNEAQTHARHTGRNVSLQILFRTYVTSIFWISKNINIKFCFFFVFWERLTAYEVKVGIKKRWKLTRFSRRLSGCKKRVEWLVFDQIYVN